MRVLKAGKIRHFNGKASCESYRADLHPQEMKTSYKKEPLKACV